MREGGGWDIHQRGGGVGHPSEGWDIHEGGG